METLEEIPILRKSKVTYTRKLATGSNSCCAPKNTDPVCCEPDKDAEATGGPCCPQPADGSACCEK